MIFEWNGHQLHYTDESPWTSRPGETHDARAAQPTPLLFLHGLGGRSGNWLHQRRHFSATRRVIALDLPGHGLSTGTALPFRSYPDAVDAALDHCGIERLAVVGLSMGARAGLAFAARRPRRVQSLTIVNTFLALRPAERTARLALYDLLLRPDGVQQWAKVLLDQMGVDAHSAIARGFMGSLAGLDPAHLHRIFHEAVDLDQWQELRALGGRALFVRGEQDRFIPPYCLDDLRAENPAGQVVRFPDSGHLPYLQDPNGFNHAIASFVDSFPEDATDLPASPTP